MRHTSGHTAIDNEHPTSQCSAGVYGHFITVVFTAVIEYVQIVNKVRPYLYETSFIFEDNIHIIRVYG